MFNRIMQDKIDSILQKLNWNKSDFILNEEELGNTNLSFKCEYKSKKYIFRIGTSLSDKISINRDNEMSTVKMLSNKYYGFESVYFDKATGDMVSGYICGKDITKQVYQSDEFINDLIKLLNAFHSNKSEYSFNPYQDIEQRISIVKNYLPQDFNLIYIKYKNIADKYMNKATEYSGFCHNDTYIKNFVYDNNDVLHIVDYEFSGMGDAFFDLACIAYSPIGSWKPRQKQKLLLYTVGKCDDETIKRLDDFIVIQLMWNYTWSLVKKIENLQKFQEISDDYSNKLKKILCIL